MTTATLIDTINKSNVLDKKQLFLRWFDDFINIKHGGYFPPNKEEWFDSVNDNHEEIREIIGGEKISLDIVIQEKTNPISDEKAHDLYRKITNIEYGFGSLLESGSYVSSYHKLYYPVVTINSHNSIKTGKAISTVLKKKIKNNKEKSKLLDGILSELAIEWSKCIIKETSNLNIVLDTSCEAFCNIGHYGCDRGSCFAQGRENTTNKYNLGKSKNTFVIVIKNKGSDSNIARCWGFLSKDKRTFNILNFYSINTNQESMMIESLKILFAELFGCGKEDIFFHENKSLIKGSIYRNPYGNWSFSLDKDIEKQILEVNHVDNKVIRCMYCANLSEDIDKFDFVDELYSCANCVKITKTCEYTNTLTRNPLYDVVVSFDGKKIKINSTLAEEVATYCKECLQYVKNELFEDAKCPSCKI